LLLNLADCFSVWLQQLYLLILYSILGNALEKVTESEQPIKDDIGTDHKLGAIVKSEMGFTDPDIDGK